MMSAHTESPSIIAHGKISEMNRFIEDVGATQPAAMESQPKI